MKRIILSLLIIAIMIGFTCCSFKTRANLYQPDKIIMYSNDKQKDLIRNKDQYSKILYDRIFELTKTRMPETLSTIKMPVSDKNIKEAKRNAVEFIYNKPRYIIVDNGNKTKIEYNQMIFPLNQQYQNITFIKQTDGYYTPVGLMENLDHLVEAAMR